MNVRRPETKQCAMCGRRMTLETERLAPRPPGEAWLLAPVAFQYYAWTNVGCEHVERAA
jgi:hypothetical protein